MRRIEPAAVLGVMSREVANFRTFWRSTTFSSLMGTCSTLPSGRATSAGRRVLLGRRTAAPSAPPGGKRGKRPGGMGGGGHGGLD